MKSSTHYAQYSSLPPPLLLLLLPFFLPAALMPMLAVSISSAEAHPAAAANNYTNNTKKASLVMNTTAAAAAAAASSVSAILVFGDSTVDPGNNNYVETLFKSNFPPYGRDFDSHIPTGRFTNGRLATDFVASYMGLKDYLPPYLDPTLSTAEMMTGVSFASAGCGFDPLTPALYSVIEISRQLELFREYKWRLEMGIGKENMERKIKEALFIVSAGTNDFVVNYFTVPIRRKSFTVSSYQQFLLQQVQQFIQGLWDEGARKILFAGLPPMGCLPLLVTLRSNNVILSRNCLDTYSTVARDYNQMLKTYLSQMQNRLANYGARIAYIDLYNPVIDMIQMPRKFGFDEVSKGCCGTGFLEASLLCNPKSYVCPDASTYVFWDSIHPTEKAYYIIFLGLQSTLDSFIKY